MKTAELIRNDNVYRAIGGECWIARVHQESKGALTMGISPEAWKVEVTGRDGDLIVVISNSGARRMKVGPDALHDTREEAMKVARKMCEDMDGKSLMGAVTYRYKRPKPAKVEIEYRIVIVSASEGTHAIEYRDPASRRWKPVYGLFLLTRWKANDCLKRLRRGDEIPGYWRLGDSMEFIELADNVE